ncbi:anaerobic ribonucleoside-triphosphate reductase-like protein [Pseudoduganella flava]|uniref:Anaerobic ribonucleoside-triphosphate reductase-like protein n=1 Tax=Pseudoduganella flava TaxID=871742 RepID=A0A562PBI4_9BURK|nr:anaerobic ribonucleoside-triphosphate reductase [Pseudoduganella flava]QGZ38000.1 hypothetical protein GO485_02335 [Pseudoduganella flava]TWI41822.1 anaerobic ribonucleoside-triphosphate reductase-like protein [Pseudoduganella flava]
MTDTRNSNIVIELSADDPERQPCEIWTRVMGYHRPVSSFNIGKQGEFHERRWFREDAICTANAVAQAA